MADFASKVKAAAFLIMLHIIIYGIIFKTRTRNESVYFKEHRYSFKTPATNYQQKLQLHTANTSIDISPNTLVDTFSSRLVIISLAVSTNMTRGYEFCLPIVVAAWKRIGWHSLIFVIDSSNMWQTSHVLELVREQTLKLDPMTRFVRISVSHNPVSYAQVSRLFAGLFAPWIRPDDIVMTSDIDLVPIKKEIFDEVLRTDISLLNTDCCGMFSWNNTKISMQPMSYIAMKASNWQKVMEYRPLENNESEVHYINSWLHRMYGKTISNTNVVKGGNEAWFLDQRVVSIQLHKSNLKIYKRRQRTSLERVDRARVHSWNNFKHFMDAHMYYDCFKGTQWDSTFRLIKDIFSVDVARRLKFYRDKYVETLKITEITESQKLIKHSNSDTSRLSIA